MRKKSITLLIGVYAALCISYTVAGSAMVSENSDIIQTVSQESSDTVSQSSSSNKSSGTVKEKSSVSETESSSSVSKNKSNTVSDKKDAEPEVTEKSDNSISESKNNFSDTESQNNDVIEPSDSEEESQEQISEDEYQENKPSLTEYLSGLRCSGCRHNCSLLSPRCMNGARKASQAESQYYSIYNS